MRKVTLKLDHTFFTKIGFNSLFKVIESMELIEFIKLDYEKLIEVAVTKINLKKGKRLEDIKFPKFAGIIEVFKKESNSYVCMLRAEYPRKFKPLFDLLNADVIWDRPCLFKEDYFVISFIGDEKNLKKAINGWEKVGKVKNISYKNANYKWQDKLYFLTKRQREILIKAKELGYYKYPRKINADKLSRIIGCSKPTLIEHLRNIENRLINSILGEE